LVVLALIPLILLSGIGYKLYSNIVLELIVESNLKTIGQVQNQLEVKQADIDDILIQTSIHPDIQDMLKNTSNNGWDDYVQSRFFAEYTHLLMIGNPEIYKITIINERGKRFDSLGRFMPTDNLSDTQNYELMTQELKEGTVLTAISPIYRTYGKRDIISFGKMVLDLQSGKPLGVVIVDLNLKTLNLEFNKVDLLDSGKIILLDKDNKVIIHPEKETGADIEQLWLLQEHPDEYFFHRNYEGEQFLYLQSELPDLQWSLFGVIPYEGILRKTENIRNIFIFFLLVIIGVIGIVAFSLRKVFVRPIWKLQQLMERFQAGEFNVRARFQRKDEIGQLAESFNIMVDRLENLIQQVYQVKLNESRALLYQKQAELQALQAQITPHFLYNTLNSISWFAHRKGVREIQLVTESLSAMLQYTLGNSSKFVTLEEEFHYLKLFDEIIDFRYGGSIQFEYELPDSLKIAMLPRLTLQPFVENALKHGFDDIVSDNKKIRISAREEESDIIISVWDNGAGMTHEGLEKVNYGLSASILNHNELSEEDEETFFSRGMGMSNVHRRLQLWFGEKYGLKVKSELGVGTLITIRIPSDGGISRPRCR